MGHKVFLSPSDQTANTYAAGSTNEAEQCGRIAVAAKAALERCGFEVMVVQYETMANKCAKSDAFGAELHVPIHSNAFNGQATGTRVYYGADGSSGHKAAKAILARLGAITPGAPDLCKPYPELYEIRTPKAPTAYIETDFHDNPEVARWIIDHTEQIGEAICAGICDYFGVAYTAEEKEKNEMQLDRIIAVRTNKTIYCDEDKCYKVFNEDYSKADVLNEALNQARVEETGLFIPKILEVTMIDGKWTLVSEYIEGKSLSRLMKENPEKKDEYMNLFVDLQLEMHEKTCPLLNRLKDKMNRKISATDLSATVRYELHTRLESMPKHKKLCHGDFNPTNVIITPKGDWRVIDWSHVRLGDPLADVARTYLLFWLSGHVKAAEQYVALMCDALKARLPDVQKWLPIVAAAESSKPNTQKNLDLLLHWASVVDIE